MSRADIFEKRLEKAAKSENPLSFAIVCYQSIRESPLFNEYKVSDRDKMEELVKDSIVSAAIILENLYGWESDKISDFLKHMQELTKEI